MRRSKRAAPAAVLAALLALSACSGSGDDDTAGAGGAALEEAVRAYIETVTIPDTESAWPMLSERCQDEWGREEFEQRAQFAFGVAGEQEVEEVTVDQLEGDLARVSYSTGVEVWEGSEEAWVRENGQWRLDSC